ncbi:CGNR zinc finger domain-containing protein [Kineococcus glutinatus]|uniref:CGNR zinc finger domain-containing protein n=1 Tax=Kineococcus glutinatus TaxID=1070872 RepID=A0ABP9HV89_9ACTN
MSADAAPGRLEAVRALLTTWSIPNDTRHPADALDALAADPDAWERALPGVPVPAPGEVDELRALREDLRAALGDPRPVALAGWLERHRLAPRLQADGDAPVRLVPQHPGAAAELLARVVDAVADGTWYRLRACPDCAHAFYDTSRNASRTWCRMVRGDASGRSCGSIAKARAKRARDRGAREAAG